VAWFGGYAFDTWGDYLPAFGVSAAGLVLATVALLAVARR
jgi:flagellar motor component MotA